MIMEDCPIWYHDPKDTTRYALARHNTCPADGTTLYLTGDSAVCVECRRVFDKNDGSRIGQCWWSGFRQPTRDELGAMLMRLLRSATPDPVESPAMWDAWGEVCKRVGLNPDDYRIPTSG